MPSKDIKETECKDLASGCNLLLEVTHLCCCLPSHAEGGSPCRRLRDVARTIAGREQLFMIAFARALEVIPRQLCDNAGFDATDVLNKLRQKHALPDGSGKHFGVDVNTGGLLSSAASALQSPQFQSQREAPTMSVLTVLSFWAMFEASAAV